MSGDIFRPFEQPHPALVYAASSWERELTRVAGAAAFTPIDWQTLTRALWPAPYAGRGQKGPLIHPDTPRRCAERARAWTAE